MDKKFGELVKNVHSHKTPGMPNFLVIRQTEEQKKVFVKDQWILAGCRYVAIHS